MSSNQQLSTRRLLRQLRDLGSMRAPDSLLSAILSRIGLEEGATVEVQTMERTERRDFVSAVSESLHTEYSSSRSSSHVLALGTSSLAALEVRCMSEIKNFRNGEAFNDRYCLEIFYRAITKQNV